MNNKLYRKLTSITLATVMFAGGMTVAMPGELPVAVAQTTSGTLSVSATGSFGGPQVIEIIVDDPDRADSDSPPTVTINEEAVEMRQATTGKWYAYVADDSFATSGLAGAALAGVDDPANRYSVKDGFLVGAPALLGTTQLPSGHSSRRTSFDDGRPSRSRPTATRWPLLHTKTAAPSR